MRRRHIRTVPALAALGAIAASSVAVKPRLVWNASDSVPIGLYAVLPTGRVRVGDIVRVTPPRDLARYLAVRAYLPIGVPMLKPIAALPGQVVCRFDRTITIDARPAGEALGRDHAGRPLPVWSGCRRLAANDIFLMNSDAPTSFDGRYFGIMPLSQLTGEAVPLWIPRRSR
jgi:conjugative transfer signal peptidase TraF